MSIRQVKASDRYYVVSTGYSVTDYISSGESEGDGTVGEDTEWPSGFVYSWFETVDQQESHPAYRAYLKNSNLHTGRVTIDSDSGLNIAKMHAAKASEAREVKFNSVTSLALLPFIAAEQSRRPSMTLMEIADEIWAEHIADADPESARTEAKRNL